MTDGCSQASEESIKYRKTIFDKSMVCFALFCHCRLMRDKWIAACLTDTHRHVGTERYNVDQYRKIYLMNVHVSGHVRL